MATKKPSKSTPKTAPEVSSAGPIRFTADPIMGARAYLMSVGTQADHIDVKVVWAKSKGLEIATVSQWKELFSKF